MDCSQPGPSVYGDSPGKNIGTVAGCHALLQGIFWTQGSNPGLPHCRQIFYCLNYQGSPIIQNVPLLDWLISLNNTHKIFSWLNSFSWPDSLYFWVLNPLVICLEIIKILKKSCLGLYHPDKIFLKSKNTREESRWRRNRMGRPLSLLQIHRRNNWTVNKVHKTTSDR